MSQWANEHPEQMEEIARLPLREQNAALRDAMGYDPDRIREYAEERIHHHRDLSTPSAGGTSSLDPSQESGPPAVDPSVDTGCPNCEAPAGEPCQHWCHWEAIS